MKTDSTERIERRAGSGVAVAFAASALLAGALLPFGAFAEFKVDRSAMGDAYWKIWNDEVQAKIDADIEKYRKADAAVEVDAPFRGFRGRYRLAWADADGKPQSKLVELK